MRLDPRPKVKVWISGRSSYIARTAYLSWLVLPWPEKDARGPALDDMLVTKSWSRASKPPLGRNGRPVRRRCKVYEFAIVVLLGIGTFKVVDMLNEYVDLSKVQSILTIALGALIAWALEFSLFASWDIAVRSDALSYIGTGLMIAAAGYAAPQVFEHVGEVLGHRRSGDDTSHVRAA